MNIISNYLKNGSKGDQIDDFNYSYYSGTNKLQRVTGSGTQYTYDANGNMTTDDLNINKNIKYDHRNLITELQNGSLTKNDSLIYYTYYRYDESGNRFAKTVYKYSGTSEPTETPEDETESFDWDLFNVEIYSRDVSGREMAIYKNDTLLEYPVYGLDMIGKIKDEEVFFYMKDHLGSVRAVLNSTGGLVSAQDYDAWGYLLENRVFDSDVSVYKFTSKERDDESKYDYFGARYYDAKVGRWGQVEPLLDKYPQISPYIYSLNNPLNIDDPTGTDPRRNQMANLNEVVNLLQSYEGSTIESFIFNALPGNESSRYVYGENGGFIDLVHFFAAADVTTKYDISLPKGIAYYMGRTLGDFVEIFQTLKIDDSMFDPEDLPSNDQGAEFGLTLDLSESFLINEDFIKKFEEFMLNQVKIIDKDDPSIARDKVRIRENQDDKPLEPRFERTPYRGD